MGELQKKLQDIWYAERPRWILWLPVWVGIGAGGYFGLENEPPLWPFASMAALFGIVALLGWRHMPVRLGAGALFWLAAGMALAILRTQMIAAPVLQHDLLPREVRGVVAEITTRPKTTRITLANPVIAGLPAEDTPKYVTVSLREHLQRGVELGDTVELRAGFFPPPKPAIAGGYAFNRHFFFRQIGAMGYTPGIIQPQVVVKATEADGFAGWIARKRHDIAQWLMQNMGMREGPVAAALMVGDDRAIADDIYEAMRQSGLVHILSISGMHLTLAAGIMFFAARLVLACIPAFSLRYDNKKAAAILALAGTFAYLLLAGSPIPAQRSFVMVALVLGAVILSRSVTPMRSLCLAGLLLLLVMPEVLLNPGFQLSFAATMAILAYYEHWVKNKERIPSEEWGWKQRQIYFWQGLLATSVAATLATTPYILYHFHGLPVYSVLANLLVGPLASFWIMPAIVAIMLLLPLGMADWLLPVLKLGIRLMNGVAEWVYRLPYAVADVPPLSTASITCITLGGLWLCLWQTRWRWWGIVPIIAGLCSLLFYQPPDMVLSGDGRKIAIRVTVEDVAMLRGQRKGFTQEGWLRFMRTGAYTLRRTAPEDVVRCDAQGCVYHWQGKEVAISYHRSTLPEDCAQADVVITPDWSVYGAERDNCNAPLLLDRRWLRQSHGVAIWLEGEAIRLRTVRETLGNRPWSGIH